MKPADAQKTLEEFIARSGLTVDALTPSAALRVMGDFYREVRAEGCHLDEDGDMLLYEWGTYDWGKGRYFELDIARQFIETGTEDDEGMSQLALTFGFHASSALDALESGDQWCHSPEELSKFESSVIASKAWQAVAAIKPDTVSLQYGAV